MSYVRVCVSLVNTIVATLGGGSPLGEGVQEAAQNTLEALAACCKRSKRFLPSLLSLSDRLMPDIS
eukprot:15134834-Alexandrium_andersonii.AAC.1